MSKKNIILINGTSYDAVTGEVLATAAVAAPKRAARSVDGVVAPGTLQQTDLSSSRRTVNLIPVSKQPVMDIARRTPQHLRHHNQEKSVTLMRTAVHKPAKVSRLKITTSTDLPLTARALVVPKLSVHAVNSSREKRAQRISRSQLINRYADLTLRPITSAAPAVDAFAPVLTTVLRLEPAPISVTSHESVASSQPSQALFEKALAQASSHQQKAPKHTSKSKGGWQHRRTRLTAGALVMAILLGVVAYQNTGALKMQLASAKAGFHASLPGYRPSGFALGSVATAPGSVAINYHSNSDDRQFAIQEQTSAWDSQALRDNFVSSFGNNFTVLNAAGRTVYLYGANSATWVSNGIWYQVKANSALSTQQVRQLIDSL